MSLLVAFDLDDTLMHEIDFVYSAWHEIAIRMSSLFGLYAEEIYTVMAKAENAYDAAAAFMAERVGDAAPSDKELVEMYRNHKPEHLPLIEGAKHALDRLKEAGTTIAIVTDGRVGTQTAKIKALGLTRWVDPADILISQATGFDKLSPDNFIALQKRHPQANSYIYVGDNPAKDFVQPRALGWLTIALRDNSGLNIHPQHFEAAPEGYAPHRVIDSLDKLPEACLTTSN